MREGQTIGMMGRIGELRAALEACVAAHKTGRYEPMVAAIENAQNVLDDTK